MHAECLDAKVRGAPHLVQNHLEIFTICRSTIYDFFYRFLGNPKYLVLLVVSQDAGHAFPIAIDAIGTDGFRLVDP